MYSINYSFYKKNPDKFLNFIFFSLFIHVILIIIFSIKWYTNIRHSTKAIDVTIVSNKSKTKPTQADFMAQNNQQGGGDHYFKNKPSTNQKNIFPDKLDKKIDTTHITETIINTQEQKINKKQNTLVSHKNQSDSLIQDNEVNNSTEKTVANNDFIIQLEKVPELTSLLKNIERRKKLFAKRPKTRYVSASTEEFRDAVYLDNWRRKIEYIGNKYYPDQAKQRNLSGKVLLLVALKANGQVKKIDILKSSGVKLLDDAARQTIYLAAPFDKFTSEMKKDTDVLEIIRTWSFNEDGQGQELAISSQ